ncbi:MAG: methylenetetrahydrofolate reductase [Pseudomonadota bacterium]
MTEMNMMPAVTDTDASAVNPVAHFLGAFSIEITPKHIEKIDLLAERLQPGSNVYIAMIEKDDQAGITAAARAVRDAGLEPIPHVPSRFVPTAQDLDNWLASYAGEAGVTTALVLGGGAAQPVGEFDAAIQLMQTGLFAKHGINRLGMAGHPEGNPDIERNVGKPALLQALKEKQKFVEDAGIEAHIATQFLFEAGPVEAWAEELRNEGITLPIHVGVPGPATLKTLVKYAALCGVGASAKFIRKQAMNITKLMSVSAPDGFVAGLADLHMRRPELGISRAHLYPFGGFDRLFDWLDEARS